MGWRESKESALELFYKNRHHYTTTFSGESGDFCLRDLSKFVRLNDDLYRDDSRKQDYLMGQRSVVLRILRFTNMTDEDIYNLTKITEPLNVSTSRSTAEHDNARAAASYPTRQ